MLHLLEFCVGDLFPNFSCFTENDQLRIGDWKIRVLDTYSVNGGGGGGRAGLLYTFDSLYNFGRDRGVAGSVFLENNNKQI